MWYVVTLSLHILDHVAYDSSRDTLCPHSVHQHLASRRTQRCRCETHLSTRWPHSLSCSVGPQMRSPPDTFTRATRALTLLSIPGLRTFPTRETTPSQLLRTPTYRLLCLRRSSMAIITLFPHLHSIRIFSLVWRHRHLSWRISRRHCIITSITLSDG